MGEFFHHPNRVAYCWAHSPLWSCVSIVAEAFTSQIVAIFLLERGPSVVIPVGRFFLDAGRSIGWPHCSLLRGCVLLFVIRGRQGGAAVGRLLLVIEHCIAERDDTEFRGCHTVHISCRLMLSRIGLLTSACG